MVQIHSSYSVAEKRIKLLNLQLKGHDCRIYSQAGNLGTERQMLCVHAYVDSSFGSSVCLTFDTRGYQKLESYIHGRCIRKGSSIIYVNGD